MALFGRSRRWAAVLAVALPVLSAQQSWAALVCRCGSQAEPMAEASLAGRSSEHLAQIHHSGWHHDTCDGEAPDGSQSTGGAAENSSHAQSPSIPSNPVSALKSGSIGLSCCCVAQAPPPDPSTLSFLTQQPKPVEAAPVVLVATARVAGLSTRIHGPPQPPQTRPLYIVQSSLLI
jgi:hypothetical protein